METKIYEYKNFLQEEGKASKTIKKYVSDVEAFVLWNEGRDILDETVTEYKNHLMQKDLSMNTINSKISSLNSFLKYLEIFKDVKTEENEVSVSKEDVTTEEHKEESIEKEQEENNIEKSSVFIRLIHNNY